MVNDHFKNVIIQKAKKQNKNKTKLVYIYKSYVRNKNKNIKTQPNSL